MVVCGPHRLRRFLCQTSAALDIDIEHCLERSVGLAVDMSTCQSPKGPPDTKLPIPSLKVGCKRPVNSFVTFWGGWGSPKCILGKSHKIIYGCLPYLQYFWNTMWENSPNLNWARFRIQSTLQFCLDIETATSEFQSNLHEHCRTLKHSSWTFPNIRTLLMNLSQH